MEQNREVKYLAQDPNVIILRKYKQTQKPRNNYSKEVHEPYNVSQL